MDLNGKNGAAPQENFHSLGKLLLGLPDCARTTHLYKKKQALYYEGVPIGGVYLIQSGEAKVFKMGPDGRGYILRVAYAGDIVGLESLFFDQPPLSGAEMIQDGKVCFLERTTVLEAVGKDRDLAMKVIRALAAQAIAGDEERVDLAGSSVRERMARLLETLSRNRGVPAKNGVRIDLFLSREEMAEMIGTASETAMRLIKDFRDEKVVEVEGKSIIILDRDRLARRMNGGQGA